MDLLLVYANTYTLLWPQPAGLSMVARACQAAGHRVRMVDLMFEKDPDGVLRRALDERPVDLVGFSLRNIDDANYASPRSFVPDYVRWVGMANAVAPTIIGGSAVTSGGEAMLRRTSATWAMTGQGERAFPLFLSELAAGVRDFTAPGLMWLDGVELRRNPPDLSGHDQGFDWSFIDRKRYERPYMAHGLLTKSGCAHRCTFCDAPSTAGCRFMPRSPDDIVEDIRREAGTWKLNRQEYFFVDPCFNQPLDWSKQVLEAIIRSGIKIRFSALVEPTGDIDRELCRLLVRAGNCMVTALVGSLDDGVLAAGQRPFVAADIARAYQLFEAEHVLYMAQLMFGGPGETRESVDVTLRAIRRFRPVMIQSGYGVRVYPLAPIRGQAVAEGQVAEADDCLDPTFYLSPMVEPEWLKERLAGLRPPRLAAAAGWCRYIWRLSRLRW